MRGLRSTVALVVVLGALLGYIYFVDREQPLTDAAPKAKAFDVSPENIEEVALTNAAGETARVQRIDTSWQVVEPEKTEADAVEVAAMTSSLASLEVQRVVEESPTDLAQYGLNPPRIQVAFRAKDQTEFKRLLIGEKAPAGGDIYAKTPDQSRVFLISSFLEATFSKTPFDLRDKAILKFDRDKADTIEIVNGASTVQFSRQGTEWRIVKPVAARADFAAVEALVTRLDEAKMQRIVAADAGDLRQYGLTAPALRVNVGTGSAQASLLLGTADPGGLPFARDSSRPSIFTVEQSLATELTKPLADYRRKDIFDGRSFTLTRIELRRSTGTVTLEKAKAADGTDVWRDTAGKDVDRMKVEDLLGKLTGLRAASFEPVAHASLAAPVLTAVVRFDDKTETVTFGQTGTEAHASRTDEPGSAVLEPGTFEEAIKALDGLR